MQQKISLILLLSFLLSSCATLHPEGGPKITLCLVDANSGDMACYDKETNQSSTLPFSKTDKFVCLPPQDAQTFLNYCATTGK